MRRLAVIVALLMAACSNQPVKNVVKLKSGTSANCQVPTPPFPSEVLKDRTFTTATVTVHFEALPSGMVGRMVVQKSSGSSVFDSAAVKAVGQSQCEFDPPIREPIWLETTITFSLK
jgi:TonB family protein